MSNWHKIEKLEDLPKSSCDCLITVQSIGPKGEIVDSIVYPAYYFDTSYKFESTCTNDVFNALIPVVALPPRKKRFSSLVTHWMEYPEPPKE